VLFYLVGVYLVFEKIMGERWRRDAVRLRKIMIGSISMYSGSILTICFLTKLYGSLTVLWRQAFQAAAFVLKPAPGNQEGTYFTVK
jgi:hypothetical protein